MEAESSSLTLSTPFRLKGFSRTTPLPFAFDPLPRSCFAVSSDALLQTATCRLNQIKFPQQASLFSTISETLYPSRLLSFPTNPSLCPTSPKRWVLATFKTLKEEGIREQRSKIQRHRSILGQRGNSGQEATACGQGNRVANADEA